MCPRGDLNPHARDVSPNWGHHEVSVAGAFPLTSSIFVGSQGFLDMLLQASTPASWTRISSDSGAPMAV